MSAPAVDDIVADAPAVDDIVVDAPAVDVRIGLADAAAAEALIESLDFVDVLVLRRTCPSLCAATRPRLVTRLATSVVSCEGQKRALLLRALSRLVEVCPHRRSTDVAVECLSGDVRPEVRLQAAKVLASSAHHLSGSDASSGVSACLCLALRDGDERVAAAAAGALPKLLGRGGCSNQVVDAMVSGLQGHRAALVRQASAIALALLSRRGDASALTVLAGAAKGDEDWRVRLAAARGLPQVSERGDSKALDALEACLGDKVRLVRQVAQGAIVRVSPTPSQYFLKWTPDKSRGSGQRLTLHSPAAALDTPKKTGAKRKDSAQQNGEQPASKRAVQAKRAAQRVR